MNPKVFKCLGFLMDIMKNRVVGELIIGITFLIGFIIFAFNKGLREIVAAAKSAVIKFLQSQQD